MKWLAAWILAFTSIEAVATEPPVELREVTTTARRAADIGRGSITIDSAMLRESVAMSMADVLGFGSAVYVKNYGRATLSTISLRGTSASHTSVTWNGMRISSPMLGTTDFSMIPSYIIDRADIVAGAASASSGAGGLGGVVRLHSSSEKLREGFSGQYVQGIGSWRTFDEFLRLGYVRGPFSIGARVSAASSKNDFPYTNHDKKENNYDDNHQIISSYHPRERNRSGAFADFNALLGASYNAGKSGRWGLDVWYLSSNRELPLLTTDYSASTVFDNRQREQTVRSVASWSRAGSLHTFMARGGYVHTWLAYDYWREMSAGNISVMSRARSRINSFYGSFDWRFNPNNKWYISATAETYHHSVESYDYATITTTPEGFDASRLETSLTATARWRPIQRIGLAATLREDIMGRQASLPIASLHAEALIIKDIDLYAKASATHNYRFPTLNDLYVVPGGNANLRPEHGLSYDAMLDASIPVGRGKITANANWFDSHIRDWIMWLPSPRGFYVPRNARQVHAYGAETQVATELFLGHRWQIEASASYSYTASINRSGDKKSDGKQLPYIPRHSGSASLRASWRDWSACMRLQAYSERFTMSSNEATLTGRLAPYAVCNLYIDRRLNLFGLDWMAKIAVNNLFNSDYQTVLSRPMPGINFEFFISLTW